MIHTFTVLGEPRGKARPRFTRTGRPYTDAKTREYERLVRAAFTASGGRMHTGPVIVSISAFHAVPQSWPKGKRERALRNDLLPVRKPDADNIAKIVLDALNGAAWADDTQVVRLAVDKTFAEYGGMVRVTIAALNEDGSVADANQ